MTIATRPEKSHPLFPATPSKTGGPVKPPFFENLFGGSTPPIPPPAERGVVHTVKSLCLVGRGVLSPYFMKTPPILPTSLPLFQILSTTPSSTPTSHFPVTPTPTHNYSFCHPVSLAEWVITHLMCYFT